MKKYEERQISIHRKMKPSLLASESRRQLKIMPTKDNPIIVSASELRDFLRCRVKHHWRHQCRLERNTGGEALAMGTLVHSIAEAWYHRPPPKRTVKAMEKIAHRLTSESTLAQLSSDDRELTKAMLIGYSAWALNSKNEDNDESIGLGKALAQVEQWFDFPLTESGLIRVRGKIDLEFQPTNLKKTIASLENKSTSQFRDRNVEMLLQLSVYLWALRRKYPKMKRYQAHFNELRKQLPTNRVRAPLFRRDLVERNDEEIEQWASDTERVALDMLDGAIYPNPTSDCSWDCDYVGPCLLRGNPSDLKFILSTEYHPKEKTA